MEAELRQQAHRLPETPGVYLFYPTQDTTQAPVYIGKSINLKQRVLSHIYAAKRDAKEARILSQTQHIAYHVTPGEIGALLLESQLIKTQLPHFNRRLRKTTSIVFITLEKQQPFLTPVIQTSAINQWHTHANSYGLFRSRRHALQLLESMIRQHGFCKKVLRLESATNACFNYQLGRCQGACIGKESADSHNTRLTSVLEAFKHRIWPIEGIIGLPEKHPDVPWQDVHFIDQWRLIGTKRYAPSTQTFTPPQTNQNQSFDIDHYKILCQALFSKTDNDIPRWETLTCYARMAEY